MPVCVFFFFLLGEGYNFKYSVISEDLTEVTAKYFQGLGDSHGPEFDFYSERNENSLEVLTRED